MSRGLVVQPPESAAPDLGDDTQRRACLLFPQCRLITLSSGSRRPPVSTINSSFTPVERATGRGLLCGALAEIINVNLAHESTELRYLGAESRDDSAETLKDSFQAGPRPRRHHCGNQTQRSRSDEIRRSVRGEGPADRGKRRGGRRLVETSRFRIESAPAGFFVQCDLAGERSTR